VHLVNPSVHLAVSAKTPDAVLEAACDTLLRGDGYPAMFNDELILEGLERAGVAREDAVEYVPCSCVEITVGGKTNAWVASGYVNMAKLIELVLNEGWDPVTGIRAGLATPPLEQLDSFEKLYDAVRAQMRYVVMAHLSVYGKLQAAQRERPFPLLSCVIRDCLERGRNIGDGDTAARYVFTEPEAVGMTNLADSLAALDRLIYTEKRLTLEELRDALAADFAGQEPLRLMLLNDAPKFGNDDDYVDHFMAELTELWHGLVLAHRSVLGGRYLPGYLAWMMHAALGEHTGALPDGRHAGLPLADGVGPAQGRDRHGPTAVVGSLSKLDLRDALAGVVHNFRFDPRVLTGASRPRFMQFLRTLFARGGAQAQINVISPEILREAQRHPERYRDLVVRVAGFSALFTPLASHVQGEIIERTTHEMV
jgi:pyruvate-formate lyase